MEGSRRGAVAVVLVVLVVGLVAYAAQRVVGESSNGALVGATGSCLAVAALLLVRHARSRTR